MFVFLERQQVVVRRWDPEVESLVELVDEEEVCHTGAQYPNME
jgi:hypothetical protein